LVEAKRAVEVADADSLLDRLEGWATRIETAIDAVEGEEDYAEFWKGVAVLRPYLELIGEITKELERRPQVSLHLSPEWVELRTVIVQALDPYPVAKWAVVEAIKEVEGSTYDGS